MDACPVGGKARQGSTATADGIEGQWGEDEYALPVPGLCGRLLQDSLSPLGGIRPTTLPVCRGLRAARLVLAVGGWGQR